jgi:DNA-directed RNA polymerase subunit K
MKYTKYEKARLIGARSLQISMGAPIMAKLTPEDISKLKYNPIEIAKIEMDQGLIPMEIKKPSPRSMPAAVVA